MFHSSLGHFLGNRRSGLTDRAYKLLQQRQLEEEAKIQQQQEDRNRELSKEEFGRDIEKQLKREQKEQKKVLQKEKKAIELAKKLKKQAPDAQKTQKEELGKGFVAHTKTLLRPKRADEKAIKKATRKFDLKTLRSQLKRTAEIVQTVSISPTKGTYNPLIKQAGDSITKRSKTGVLNLQKGLGAHPIAHLMQRQGLKMAHQLQTGYNQLLKGNALHVDDPNVC